MSSSKNTPSNATKPQEQRVMPTFTGSTALAELWDRASIHMPANEVKWFARGAASEAALQSQQLADVVEGIGCLINSDENSGTLQDKQSVSNLLFLISNQLSAISGWSEIANFANDRLQDPDYYKRNDDAQKAKA